MKFLKGCLTSIGGLVVLLMLAGLLLDTGNKTVSTADTVSTNNVTEIAAADSSTAPQKSVALGIWANVADDRSIKVDRSDVLESLIPANQFATPVDTKGGKLIVVYLSLKNTGQESGNMFWSTFQLQDSQERKYDDLKDFEELSSVNLWLSEQGLANQGDQIFPGGTAQTAKIFRVAPNATGLKLIVKRQPFDI